MAEHASPREEHGALVDALEEMAVAVSPRRADDGEQRPKANSKPSRKALKQHVAAASGSADPVLERMADWERRRDDRLSELRRSERMVEARECTFHPETYSPAPGATNEQRFEDRLALKARASAERKRRLVAEAESLAREECTFKPEIHPSPIPHHADATSMYSSVSPAQELHYTPVEERTTQSRINAYYATDWRNRIDPECTFSPIVSRHAESVYRSERAAEAGLPVHERLYQKSAASKARRSCSGDAARGNVEDCDDPLGPVLSAELAALRGHFRLQDRQDPMLTFYCNALGTDDPTTIMATLNRGADSESDDDVAEPSDDEDVRYVRFNEFISRQNDLERRRQQHIQQVRDETQPSHQPTVCPRSRALASAAKNKPRAPKPAKWDEPTFKPALSKTAEGLHRRGTDDMTRDAQRVAAKREERLAEKDREEDKELTFQPATNSQRYPQVQSWLSVKNLRLYTQRMEGSRQQREARRIEMQRRKENAEVAECTFQPQLNELPSYIRDMAQSSHVLRDSVLE